jgi:hypothetical protein
MAAPCGHNCRCICLDLPHGVVNATKLMLNLAEASCANPSSGVSTQFKELWKNGLEKLFQTSFLDFHEFCLVKLRVRLSSVA